MGSAKLMTKMIRRSQSRRPGRRFAPAAMLLLAAAAPAFPAIALTQVPAGMRKQNADISIAWTGGAGRVHLRASTTAGGQGAPIAHYDSLHLPSQTASGSYTFRVNPDIPAAYRNTDLRFGLNYCIVTDGTSASPEFVLILESSNAPVLAAPANASSIKDPAPTFSWTGDAPYYALLVSDEPFKIAEDGTVTGVSAIWQIITPYKSARYGDRDPSGLNGVPAPPLISGKTYNWLVLNNYGNNSASTSKVAPVPASFKYLPAPPLPEAVLIEPKDKDTIPGSDRIVFRWGLVDGAVSYKLELLEENLVDGSQADVSLWKAASTGGQIALDNASSLLRRFNYKWRVYAVGGNGSASLSAKRSFFYAVAVGDINLSVKDQAGRKVAYVPVKVNRLGGSASAVYQSGSTDAEGTLSIKNAPLGTYEIRIENADGYQPRIDTLVHALKTGSSRTLTLAPALGRLVGRIVSAATGTGILNARLIATGSDGAQWTAQANSQGNYALGLPYGIWQLKAQADGFAAGSASAALSSSAPSRTVDFSLTANRYTLSGTVRNSYTGQGIFGAAVQLTQDGIVRTANTDGNGLFSFSVGSGAAALRVSCAGFASPEPLSLSPDGNKTLSIALDPNASILSGRARDVSGTGISGAVITATPKAGPARTAVCDAQGTFELSLPAGDWALSGSAKGYSSLTVRNFLLDISKTVQGVDFTFSPNRSQIAGRVTVNGAGLAGAAVVSGDASALSDNGGYYRLAVTAGTRTVGASKVGYLVPKVWTLAVKVGDSLANVDFAATGNAGVVKGRVLSGGAGVVGAVVKAVNQATREAFTVSTDPTGAFALSLPGAAYTLSAAKEGFALEAPLSVDLPPGATLLDQNPKLAPDIATVSGTVSSGNAALAGCEVVYRNAADAARTGRTTTDPQGRYSFSLQAGAAYALTAACAGYQSAAAATEVLSRGSSSIRNFNLAAAGAVIRGKVVDAAGKALPGAQVSAARDGSLAEAVTDFGGAYSLNVAAGTYALTVSRTGYRIVRRSLTLALGGNANVTDTLKASVGRLAGRVLSAGAPVAGAQLTLVGASADAGGGLFVTDADGRYLGENLAAGTYSLAASAEGFSDARLASLTITDGGLTTADLTLSANRGVLAGTVIRDGSPAAGIAVAATAYGIARSALTGADGKYRIERLPAGTYAVSATLDGYSADKAYAGQALASGATLSGLDFALTRNAGSLAGTITGAANAAGIQVAAAGAKKGARGYAICDAAGKYAMPSLPADDYTITVNAPGYKIASGGQAPVIAVTGEMQYDIALAPAVFRLAGRILNQAGGGVPSLPLELRAGEAVFKANSLADGSYAFAGVPAGQEYLLACRPPTAEYDARDTSFSQPLEGPATVDLDLRTVSRRAGVAGSVTLDGKPAEGALIRVLGNGNALADLSQPGGSFKVSGVAGSEKPVSLTVSRTGAGAFDTTLIVPLGTQVTGVTVALKTLKIAVTCHIEDSDGRPLAGARLVAAAAGGLDTLAADAQGRVVLTGLPANQALTLATLLEAGDYDNAGATLFPGGSDTSVTLRARVHATTLTVGVKDKDGVPLDGAEVLVNGTLAGKTAQGSFAAAHLAGGEYVVLAGKAGYRSGNPARISVSGDTSVAVDQILERLDGGVYGTVRDTGLDARAPGGTAAATALPLPAAIVMAVAGIDTLRDTADALGRYAIEGLVSGRAYALSVALPGYAPLTATATGADQPQARDLVLRPYAGSVVGRIEGGRAGIVVRLAQPSNKRIVESATRHGGYYAFTGLQHGSDYLVQAVDGSRSSPAAGFQADGAAAKRFDPVLADWGGIGGTVRTAAGKALAGAYISCRNTLTGALVLAAADSAGRFDLAGLAAGEYEVSADRAGYREPLPVVVRVAAGGRTALDFSLEPSAAGIGGLAADAAGRGLAADILLARGPDTLRALSGEDGQFVFAGLAEGDYLLSASKAGYTAPSPVSITYAGEGLETRTLILTRRANTLSGRVRDAVTNAPLADAAVAIEGGESVTTDSLGHFQMATPSGAPQILLAVSLDGYLSRTSLPVYLDADGSAAQDIALTADYKFDGRINVTVREGPDPVPGLFLTLQSFHPDDSLAFSLSGEAASSFRDLRRPVPYLIKAKREGYPDLSKVVELTAKTPALDVDLSYPTSRIRIYLTSDGQRGKSAELTLNGVRLPENADTAGLFESGAKLDPGRYEVAVRSLESDLLPLAAYFIDLGRDSVRTDTLPLPFVAASIADTAIGEAFEVRVRRLDSLHPAPAAVCSLYYRPAGDPAWGALRLDSAAGGFAGSVPAQTRTGTYEYYFAVHSPRGARSGAVSGESGTSAEFPLAYSDAKAPRRFSLRDPYLLRTFALAPQRLEGDTSLYTLNARDLFEAGMRGEDGRSLDERFDERANAGDPEYQVKWSFGDPDRAAAAGLKLEKVDGRPRMIAFAGGAVPSDTAFRIDAAVRMGDVRLQRPFYVKIQDLVPVSIGIGYVKENRILEDGGAALPLSNSNPAGYAFAAFARTAEGRLFNILPHWSLGGDTAAGTLDQLGVFTPDPAVARSAVLHIYDTLPVGQDKDGRPLYGAFHAAANLATLAQVTPSQEGRSVVTNGEGAVLDFNRAGLSKAFTVSIKTPPVSGLLRSSPAQEVVGDILEIELSESQPFKADSGAQLRLPVAEGVARKRTVYLGHWNSALLAWEKVDSSAAGEEVGGTVRGFSKYAVLMGSLPLGAYDLTLAPNPFSADDPWGLQLGYKVSSDVSSQVGVRVEVYNMMGDKVYESEETQIGKGDAIVPGTRKADPRSAERRGDLGKYVWDGRDTAGHPCRNGRYLLKLIVKDGRGSKEYLRKVVMLK